MKTKLMLIAAGLLSLTMTREAGASGACTAARFHDWKDMGCNQNYAGTGSAPSGNNNPGGNQSNCNGDCGMPRWWVHEPYINLWMSDTPLSYTMSSGEQMNFRLSYRQRYSVPEQDDVPDFYSVCPYSYPISRLGNDYYAAMSRSSGMTNAMWANNWMMDVIFWDTNYEQKVCNNVLGNYKVFSSGYQALVFRPEGGCQYFYSNNVQSALQDARSQVKLVPQSGLSYPTISIQTPVANGIYWGNSTNGFRLVYPDGSQDVFGLTAYAPMLVGTSTSRALLTQKIDPQGRITQIGYQYAVNTNYNSTVVAFGYRVCYVVDPDGRTNTFLYAPNSSNFLNQPVPNPWQLTEVDDPYGRKVQLGYTMLLNSAKTFNFGILTSITDAAGLTSSFQYPAPVVTYTNYVYGSCSGGVCPTNIVGLGVSSGWITNLTTPYGNTAFSYYQVAPDSSVPDAFQQRAIYASEPTGAKQLYYYLHNGSGLMSATATAPSGTGQTNLTTGIQGQLTPRWIIGTRFIGDGGNSRLFRQMYWLRCRPI